MSDWPFHALELSPVWRQAIIWTNAVLLLIGPLETNFSQIVFENQTLSFRIMRLKMSSGNWRPSCLGLNVLMVITPHDSYGKQEIQMRAGYSSGRRLTRTCEAGKSNNQGLVSISDRTSYRKISWSREIGSLNYRIAVKFDRHIGSSAAEELVKFQSDHTILNTNFAASRLHEILQ